MKFVLKGDIKPEQYNARNRLAQSMKVNKTYVCDNEGNPIKDLLLTGRLVHDSSGGQVYFLSKNRAFKRLVKRLNAHPKMVK